MHSSTCTKLRTLHHVREGTFITMQEQHEQAAEEPVPSITNSISGLRTESVRLDGLLVPCFLDIEWIKSMKDIELRPDDIWIVTYPKSGTTWTQQIVRLIVNRGKDNGVVIEEAVPWVEGFSVLPNRGFKYYVDIDKMTSPRAFKSHLPYEMMPCGLPSSTPGKYINVIRNPKDVAVSYFTITTHIPITPTMSGTTSSICSSRENLNMETFLTTFRVGGLTKMTIMCSFSGTRT